MQKAGAQMDITGNDELGGEVLPTEIWQEVFRHMDLRTLATCREVSIQFKTIVKWVRPFAHTLATEPITSTHAALTYAIAHGSYRDILELCDMCADADVAATPGLVKTACQHHNLWLLMRCTNVHRSELWEAVIECLGNSNLRFADLCYDMYADGAEANAEQFYEEEQVALIDKTFELMPHAAQSTATMQWFLDTADRRHLRRRSDFFRRVFISRVRQHTDMAPEVRDLVNKYT